MFLDRSNAPQRILGRDFPTGARTDIAFTKLIAQVARGERNAMSQDVAVDGIAKIKIGIADRHRRAIDVVRNPSVVADNDDFLWWWRRCRLSRHRRARSEKRDSEDAPAKSWQRHCPSP